MQKCKCELMKKCHFILCMFLNFDNAEQFEKKSLENSEANAKKFNAKLFILEKTRYSRKTYEAILVLEMKTCTFRGTDSFGLLRISSIRIPSIFEIEIQNDDFETPILVR